MNTYTVSILLSLEKKEYKTMSNLLLKLLDVIKVQDISSKVEEVLFAMINIFEKDNVLRKRKENVPNYCLEATLNVISTILSKNYKITNPNKFYVLILNLFYIYLEKESILDLNVSNEELKCNLLTLFHVYLKTYGDQKLFITERLSTASFIGLLLSCAEEKSRKLKNLALDVVRDLIIFLKDPNFLYQFLPGVSSKLKLFITGDYKLGKEFLSNSIKTLQVLITTIYTDQTIKVDKELLTILEGIFNPTIYNQILAKEDLYECGVQISKIFKQIYIYEIVMIGYYDEDLTISRDLDLNQIISLDMSDSYSERFLFIVNKMIRNVHINNKNEEIYSNLILIKSYLKLFKNHFINNQNILSKLSLCLLVHLEYENNIKIFERNQTYIDEYPKVFFKYLNDKNEKEVLEIIKMMKDDFLVYEHFKDIMLEDPKYQKECLYILENLSEIETFLDVEFQYNTSFDYVITSYLLLKNLSNTTKNDIILSKVFYFILERLGDEYSLINQSAFATLNEIARKLKYDNLNHMIVKNYDYVIDELCNRMKYLDQYPNTPLVLKSLFRYFENVDIQYSLSCLIEDILESIFLSMDDNQNLKYLNTFFSVLHAFTKYSNKDLMKKILQKSQYLISFYSLRIQMVDIIQECVKQLKEEQDQVLPIIHSIWSYLLNDTNLTHRIHIISFIQYLIQEFPDFMYQKVVNEYYPKLIDFIKTANNYKHTNEFIFTIKIFDFLQVMLVSFKSRSSVDHYELCSHLLKFLQPNVHKEYQNHVFKVYQSMLISDPDPVWLFVMKQTNIKFERENCKTIEFKTTKKNEGIEKLKELFQ